MNYTNLEFFNNPMAQVGLILLSIWSLVWKGLALWRAARNSQRNWFIAMLVINTAGILEIVYLFYFNKAKGVGGPSQQSNDQGVS